MSSRNTQFLLKTLALAVTATLLSAPAWSAHRVNVSRLSNNKPVEGVIVTYRPGSANKANVAAMQRSLDRAVVTAFGRGKALKLRHERALGVGADLIGADRKLDRVEA